MKIKKSDLFQLVQEQAEMIAELSGMVELNKMSIIKLENEREKPQLKQLDQSIFDGLDEKWRFAAVDANGRRKSFKEKPYIKNGEWLSTYTLHCNLGLSYDTSNWQNSLIEREKKDLLEVDLSSELTGSDLCRKMLERGDKFILCSVDDRSDNDAINDLEIQVIGGTQFLDFVSQVDNWKHAVPINNQGEPLTASEVGL